MRLGAHAQVLVFSLLAAIGFATSARAGTTPIVYCGQQLHGRGFLVADLDCSGYLGHGVIIDRGTLDLNGFTIRNAGFYGVHCESWCKIRGPGSVTLNGFDGVHAENWAMVRDAIISNNGLSGVQARNINGGSRVLIKNSTITGNGLNGIETDNLAIIRDSIISNNGENGIDVGVQFCDSGGRVMVVSSTVSSNGGSCFGSPYCADVNSCGRNDPAPRLRNQSMCGTSHVRDSGAPGMNWGVCLLD